MEYHNTRCDPYFSYFSDPYFSDLTAGQPGCLSVSLPGSLRAFRRPVNLIVAPRGAYANSRLIYTTNNDIRSICRIRQTVRKDSA